MPVYGNCFATCSQDNTAALFDIRASNELARFGHYSLNVEATEEPAEGLTCLSFSGSGRLIFCGNADGNVVGFDTLSDNKNPTFTLAGAHERLVSCLGVNPNGDALCTGSWDSQLKVWA